MIDWKNPESIAFIVSLLGGIGTFFSLIWLRVVVPIIKFLNSQESISKAINDIKKELTTNGGNSLKDTVIGLRTTINRIETRQKIIEQRTKAALHYAIVSLFETDNQGRITWANENFCKLTSNKLQDAEGYDWISYIAEGEREEFLLEFHSCLSMNRKFMRISKNCDGKPVQMIGYPYKINEKEQGGFLISVSELKEV